MDAASGAIGGSRPVKACMNTGFVRPDEQERIGLHFDDAVEEMDAASAATGGGEACERKGEHRIC